MKKFSILVIASLCFWACSKKIAPVATPETIAKNEAKAAAAARVNMAMVESGKRTFEHRCGRCHILKQPVLYTQLRWVDIMESMALKAQLDGKEKADVLAYVQYYAKDAPKDRSNM